MHVTPQSTKIKYCKIVLLVIFLVWYKSHNGTFGAKVALESSWGCAFALADPSNIEGSSRIRSLDPEYFNAKMS
jgi:hypothetical protein